MYCRYCGSKNDDQLEFCAYCGTLLREKQTISEPIPAVNDTVPAPARKRFKKSVFFLIGVAVAIIFLAAIVSPRFVVERFFGAILDADGEAMLKYLPETVREKCFGDEAEQKDIAQKWTQSWENLYEMLDTYNEDWSWDYKVIEITKMDKDDFEQLQEHYKDTYDCRIRGAREVTMEFITHANGKKDSKEFTFYVVKIGVRWYIEWESYKLNGL